jgi:hypothetical protein
MGNYGYVDEHSCCLDSVKRVIEDNERLKTEMRSLLHDQMRERQQSEQSQRDTMRELPTILT